MKIPIIIRRLLATLILVFTITVISIPNCQSSDFHNEKVTRVLTRRAEPKPGTRIHNITSKYSNPRAHNSSWVPIEITRLRRFKPAVGVRYKDRRAGLSIAKNTERLAHDPEMDLATNDSVVHTIVVNSSPMEDNEEPYQRIGDDFGGWHGSQRKENPNAKVSDRKEKQEASKSSKPLEDTRGNIRDQPNGGTATRAKNSTRPVSFERARRDKRDKTHNRRSKEDDHRDDYDSDDIIEIEGDKQGHQGGEGDKIKQATNRYTIITNKDSPRERKSNEHQKSSASKRVHRQVTTTTVSPTIASPPTKQPKFTVKKVHSSEVETEHDESDENDGLAGKSVGGDESGSTTRTTTTTIGDGNRQARVTGLDKGINLSPAMRQRVIEQFIRDGGNPHNIVVSDSTITKTSKSKKKTITTVYRVMPNTPRPSSISSMLTTTTTPVPEELQQMAPRGTRRPKSWLEMKQNMGNLFGGPKMQSFEMMQPGLGLNGQAQGGMKFEKNKMTMGPKLEMLMMGEKPQSFKNSMGILDEFNDPTDDMDHQMMINEMIMNNNDTDTVIPMVDGPQKMQLTTVRPQIIMNFGGKPRLRTKFQMDGLMNGKQMKSGLTMGQQNFDMSDLEPPSSFGGADKMFLNGTPMMTDLFPSLGDTGGGPNKMSMIKGVGGGGVSINSMMDVIAERQTRDKMRNMRWPMNAKKSSMMLNMPVNQDNLMGMVSGVGQQKAPNTPSSSDGKPKAQGLDKKASNKEPQRRPNQLINYDDEGVDSGGLRGPRQEGVRSSRELGPVEVQRVSKTLAGQQKATPTMSERRNVPAPEAPRRPDIRITTTITSTSLSHGPSAQAGGGNKYAEPSPPLSGPTPPTGKEQAKAAGLSKAPSEERPHEKAARATSSSIKANQTDVGSSYSGMDRGSPPKSQQTHNIMMVIDFNPPAASSASQTATEPPPTAPSKPKASSSPPTEWPAAGKIHMQPQLRGSFDDWNDSELLAGAGDYLWQSRSSSSSSLDEDDDHDADDLESGELHGHGFGQESRLLVSASGLPPRGLPFAHLPILRAGFEHPLHQQQQEPGLLLGETLASINRRHALAGMFDLDEHEPVDRPILPGESAKTNELVSRVIDELASSQTDERPRRPLNVTNTKDDPVGGDFRGHDMSRLLGGHYGRTGGRQLANDRRASGGSSSAFGFRRGSGQSR